MIYKVSILCQALLRCGSIAGDKMQFLVSTHWHSNDRRLTRKMPSQSEWAMTLCVCVCVCARARVHGAASGHSCITQDPSLWCTDCPVVACRLNCSIACGILVPQPGIEPASPALQSRFLTTGPPGKSSGMTIMENIQGGGERGWVGEGATTAGSSGKGRFAAANICTDRWM